MSIRPACALLLLFAVATPVAAQEAVYVIRHGEKGLSGDEPALTREGRDRAASWARMLQHAGLDAVITSEARRTPETGVIIADALDLRSSAWPATDIAGLVDTLEFANLFVVTGPGSDIPVFLHLFMP